MDYKKENKLVQQTIETFKRRIGITEKSHEINRDRWGGNVNHKTPFDSTNIPQIKQLKCRESTTYSQSRDLWFTSPPPVILSCFMAFSATPFVFLKFAIFH